MRSLGLILLMNDSNNNWWVGFRCKPSHPLPRGRSYASVIHQYFGSTGLEFWYSVDDSNIASKSVEYIFKNRGFPQELLTPTEEIPYVHALHHHLCQDYCNCYQQEPTAPAAIVVDGYYCLRKNIRVKESENKVITCWVINKRRMHLS